jgi:hypothetical protein
LEDIMSKQEKFVYFATRPTNVCWNGVSFPVLPGDVIKCFPEFIAAFIPEDKYKRVPPGSKVDERPVKHTFGASPVFLRPDPTGGMPVRSEEGPRKTKKDLPKSPATIDERDVNPYEMPKADEARLELGTGLDTPSASDPESEDITTAPPSERVEKTEEEDALAALEKDLELEIGEEEEPQEDIPEDNLEEEEAEEEVEEAEEEVEEEAGDEEEEAGDEEEEAAPEFPSRTAIRKMKRDEMYDAAVANGVEVAEDAPRGTILKAMWEAFGYNEE